jgi:hypothetical protein
VIPSFPGRLVNDLKNEIYIFFEKVGYWPCIAVAKKINKTVYSIAQGIEFRRRESISIPKYKPMKSEPINPRCNKNDLFVKAILDTFSIISISKILEEKMPLAYNHYIRLKGHNILTDKKYKMFSKTKTNFTDYSQLSFNINFENFLINKSKVNVEFSCFSLSGMGFLLQPSYQLISSSYFAFSPFLNLSCAFFGSGLEGRTNGFWKTYLGCNTELKLGIDGMLSVSASVVPSYNMPYKTIADEIKYFHGGSWQSGQIGMQLIIPEELIPEFKIPWINLTIDPRRLPIEYIYSKIRDKNVVEIKEHAFGISYLLQ